MKINRDINFIISTKLIKNFEEALKNNPGQFGLIGSEYIIKVQNVDENGIEFYVRPYDRNGETINFIVKGNDIVTKTQ